MIEPKQTTAESDQIVWQPCRWCGELIPWNGESPSVYYSKITCSPECAYDMRVWAKIAAKTRTMIRFLSRRRFWRTDSASLTDD